MLESLAGSDSAGTKPSQRKGWCGGRPREKGGQILPQGAGSCCLHPVQDGGPWPDRQAVPIALCRVESELCIADDRRDLLFGWVEPVGVRCAGCGEDGVVARNRLLDPTDEINEDRGVATQDESRVWCPIILDQ